MPEYRITKVDGTEKAVAAATGAALGLGLLFLGDSISKEEKDRLKNLTEQLRKNKPRYYSSGRILGSICPSCYLETEECQWHCHMCGSSLT